MPNRLILSLVMVLLLGLPVFVVATVRPALSLPGGVDIRSQIRSSQELKELRLIQDSKNVFRVAGDSVYQDAIAVSQLVYPATKTKAHPNAQPNTVILVPAETSAAPFFPEALAAAALMQAPRNGPVLFTSPDSLDAEVAGELKRLSPTGGTHWAQVFLVGGLSAAVEDGVRSLGFSVERLAGSNALETAALIDQRLGRPQNVILLRVDDPSHGLPGVALVASSDDAGILFTEKDKLPQETLQALQQRGRPLSVYVLGPEDYISSSVEQELINMDSVNTVRRIAGRDPYATSVELARFSLRGFGWGQRGPGSGFYFATTERWQDAVSGALLARQGAHGPLLLTTGRSLPDPVRAYLEAIRPTLRDAQSTLSPNWGYVVGSADVIRLELQAEIDWLLEPVRQSGE